MKIAYNGRFLSSSKITGVERVAYNLLSSLLKIDDQNEYVIFAGKKKYINDFLTKKNVLYVECKQLTGNRMLKHFWEQVILPRCVKKYKCDVLFNPINTAPVFGIKKSVMFLCDVSFFINPKWFSRSFRYIYRAIIPMAAKKAAAIITISNSSRDDIVKYLNVERSKVNKIYPAIDEKFIKNKLGNEILLWQEDDIVPYILFAGSMDPRKNLGNLINAYIKLKKEKNIKHKLVIVGAKNTNFSKLFIEDSPVINSDIIFTGYVNDNELKSLYCNADLFIYPSYYEGFGLPPLEAMACGCPVVVSNMSSLPEVCGDAAIYIDPYDIDSIMDGMYKVLSDEKLRKTLFSKGLDRIKIFNWDRCAEKVLEIFKEVMNNEACNSS